MRGKIIFIAALAILAAAYKLGAQEKDGFIFIPNNANFIIYRSGSQNINISNEKLIQWDVYKAIARLASGKRIVTAGNDPSGLAVSEKMQAVINGLKQESMNAEDYKNYLQYAEAAVGHDLELVKRIRELALKASNGILGPDDRELLQAEASELIDEINANAANAEFNRRKVISDMTASALGLDAVNIVKAPDAAVILTDAALAKLVRRRSLAGITSNILSFQIEGKNFYLQNITESMSRILDADIAEQVTNLAGSGTVMKVKYGVIVIAR